MFKNTLDSLITEEINQLNVIDRATLVHSVGPKSVKFSQDNRSKDLYIHFYIVLFFIINFIHISVQ